MKRWFYRLMGMVAILLVIAAFAPGLASPDGRNGPPSALVWVHGAVFSSWLVLYLVQAVLVSAHRVDLHRSLGIAGGLLAVTLVVVGYLTAMAMGRRGYDLSGDLAAGSDPIGGLVFPLGDLVSFAVLVGAAMWYRRRPAVHKRLILLATAGSLMAAPLAHLIAKIPALRETPPVILLPLGALYMAGALFDRVTTGRAHPVSFWGGLGLFAWAQLRAVVIGPSDAWHAFAGWLLR